METLTKVKPAPEKEKCIEQDSLIKKPQQRDESQSITDFSTNGASYEHIFLNGSTPDSSAQTISSESKQAEQEQPYHTWRYERITLPDGTTRLKQIPLPRERFLNPQEGDYFMQSNTHHKLAGSAHNKYENRYDGDDSVGVFSDLKMKWGIAGLDEPAPDVAVVPNLKNPEKHRGTFNVPEEGTKPIFIIEVTSPNYPFDKDKASVYEQVGIQEYIIVDPHWGSDDELEFFGYYLVDGTYQSMQKDSQGRLYSATTDTYISFETGEGDEIIARIIDGTTGEELFDNNESHRERLVEKERADSETAKRQVAEERAKSASEKADSEKERADSELAKRQVAEGHAKAASEKAEAEAAERIAAEERAKAASERADVEATERIAAEERAKAALEKAEAEAAERRKLADQMAEAMAEIERLRALTAQSDSE